jgi:DNA-binding NarL/FixJ family response regulator
MRGEAFLYPAAVTTLVRDYLSSARSGHAGGDDEPLTASELEVIKLVAEGHTSDEIAELLVISRKTVDHHRANILARLEMRDRVDVTRYAIRRGLVAP